MSAEEIFALAADFGRAPSRVAAGLYDTYKQQGDSAAREWAANVRAVAPNHLPHLPAAITSETKVGLGITVDVGPEAGRKQADLGRGEEFGPNAHLSGLRAVTATEPRLMRAADTTIAALLP